MEHFGRELYRVDLNYEKELLNGKGEIEECK